jgi:hypothetical protein
MSLVIYVSSNGLHPDLTVHPAFVTLVKVLKGTTSDNTFPQLTDNWREAEVLPKIIHQLRSFADEFDIYPSFTDDMLSTFGTDADLVKKASY